MDPYPVRVKEFPIDPYYAPVKFPIYSIKVIPILDGDAKVFPSWAERKLVQLELIFDPFTLEITVLLHKRQDEGPQPEQPKKGRKPDSVVICSSFFVPVMNSEKQVHIELYRVQGAQDKILGFYDNKSPNSSLTSRIASRILAALTDLRKEAYPSLELCFQNNEDAKGFLYVWLLAFGREGTLSLPAFVIPTTSILTTSHSRPRPVEKQHGNFREL